MLENEIEYTRMAAAEQKHWWYCSLHERIVKSIQKNFSDPKEINILDAGCGTGGLIVYLIKMGFRKVVGFDISDFALSACKRNNLSVFKASLTELATHFSPKTFDVIVCCDALYFLTYADQKKALSDFYTILKPGGILILNLPSLNIFKGTHDLSVGIKQRYHHRTLKELLSHAFVDREYSLVYWPVLLSPLIGIVRTFQRLKIKTGKFRIESDISLPVPLLNSLLKAIMRFELNYLPVINFGSSIYVIAKKSADKVIR